MEHCVITEFVGIAGSGKTTRAGHLVRSCRDRGIATWFRREQPRLLWSVLPALLTRPLHVARWFTDPVRKQILARWRHLAPAGQAGAASPADWWVWMDLWWLFVAGTLRRARVAVFDEGVLQHSISGFASTGLDPAAFREFAVAYARHAGLSLVVIVDPPVAVCLERMSARNRVPERLHGADGAGIKARLEQDARCMATLARGLEDAGIRCIRVAGYDIEQDMKAIVSAIEAVV